ncbi:MAG: alpha/beta fold hydrolase [Deltaproteobacteria bacterium]|nr:MAG: alpha/beta fold hydrolase [Deltaproteobacteria bacterium]
MQQRSVTVENVTMHVVEAGEGESVLLLHGWPTSSYLWRHIVPPLSQEFHAVAPDLPGFGQSDKPLDASYSFRFYDRMLDGLVEQMGLSPVHLVVHDLGGPVGLYWATQHPEKIRSLTLLNTTVMLEVPLAVKMFFIGLRLPGLRGLLTSRWGLKAAMNLGLSYRKEPLQGEELEPYLSPFPTADARKALLKTAMNLSLKAFPDIVAGLQAMTCPVRLLYAEKDRILPAVDKEMRQLKAMIPQAELSTIPGTGHFLQEDNPEPVVEGLLSFLRQVKG